jgi:antitoxin MazE
MKSTIRKIGNSKGVIIPQSILKECQIDEDVNIEVKDMQIILTAPQNAKRKGWAEAFKEMAAKGDDQLVMPDVFNDEDVTDWTW